MTVVLFSGGEGRRGEGRAGSNILGLSSKWTKCGAPHFATQPLIRTSLPSQAAEVAKECGYPPLALAMIGAMLRLSLRPITAWQDALTQLCPVNLGAIRKVFPNFPTIHIPTSFGLLKSV